VALSAKTLARILAVLTKKQILINKAWQNISFSRKSTIFGENIVNLSRSSDHYFDPLAFYGDNCSKHRTC
jgi:hypothetical protein